MYDTPPNRRLLISYAHPDDETFGLGGAILRYAEAGVQVDLICATNGELGTVDPAYLAGYDSIADLRLAELHCAAEQLKLHEVVTFGYRDSGMMGTADNHHPDALWHAEQDDVTRRVTEIIRRVRPQVVVTFDPYGGYGHPDHIAIHRATVQAFDAAGDPARYPEQIADGLEPYQPQKLYYPIFPRGMIRLGVWITRLRGQDPRRMGRNHDMDFQAVLDATLPAHTRLDLRPYYDAWQEAIPCHASQASPGQLFPLPDWIARQLFGWQSFYRARPEVNNGALRETDLFAGVTTD
ncbi:MAG: PIG-L family deacetylase [Anaerolineae bacterium]|nr:PIG-L family deacetylase [Anaerolineae bacterium]